MTDTCPNCNMKRFKDETVCWWCNEVLSSLRHDTEKCPECGQMRNLSERVTEHIKTERLR